MTADHSLAQRYLRPTEKTFWRWSDDNAVLVWEDGTTIAFREEVVAVLDRLVSGGLPPFDCVVLLLASCRLDWHRSGAAMAWFRRLGPASLRALLANDDPRAGIDELDDPVRRGASSREDRLLGDAIELLQAVPDLPAEVRTTPAAKAVIAEVAFETYRERGAPDDAKSIVAALDEGIAPAALAPLRNRGVFLGDWIIAMRPGLERLDAEGLRLRLATGLDEPVEAAPLELPLGERVRALLDELRDDVELGGLARLAHQLLAVASVPRRVEVADDLPFGGVSDIANRGPLDRLLPSELAHDDLTLTTRIALGEALYLRRESPPAPPPSIRSLLLDTGIRTWGVPRVYVAAVALALVGTLHERDARCSAFRSRGDSVEPVDLLSKEGLEALLAALEPDPHPGPALEPFVDAARSDGAAVDDIEPVLIVSEDVFADGDFRRALAACRLPEVWVATVARSGRFELLAVRPRGVERCRQAELDLDAILADPPRPRAPLVVPGPGDLPAVFRVERFPFLLDAKVPAGRVRCLPSGEALAVLPDRRVLRWRSKDRGATQVSTLGPRGHVAWLGVDERDSMHALTIPSGRPPLHWQCDGRTGAERTTRLPIVGDGSESVFQDHGALIVVGGKTRRIDAVLMASSELCEPLSCRPRGFRIRAGGGRYLVTGDSPAMDWRKVSFDGARIVLDRLTARGCTRAEPFVCVFDLTGFEGPWAITTQGRLVCTLDGKETRLSPPITAPFELKAISADGHRILVGLMVGRAWGWAVWDLLTRRRIATALDRNEIQPVFEPGMERVRPLSGRRRRFHSLVASREHGLRFVSRRRRAVESLVIDPSDGRIRLGGCASLLCEKVDRWRPFGESEPIRDTGLGLRVATWPDGSRAWLDSRGLVHLRSSDATLPELSFALSDDAGACWASTGECWGDAYYFPAPGRAPIAALAKYVRRFVGRIA